MPIPHPKEMKLALLVAPALKFLSVEAVLAVHKEAPPNPDEIPLPAVPNVAWPAGLIAFSIDFGDSSHVILSKMTNVDVGGCASFF